MTELAHVSDLAPLRKLAREQLWQILSDPTRLTKFLWSLDDCFRIGASPAERRTGLNIYYNAIKECGIEHQTVIAQTIYAQIGARDERDAMRKIAIVNEAELESAEVRVDKAAAWMAAMLTEHPQLRELAARRLAPLLKPPPLLEAHANGEAT
jgi:hypothetical protein